MTELAWPAPSFDSLRAQLLQQRSETCAVLLTKPFDRGDSGQRFIVRESVQVPESAYASRNVLHAALSPTFVAHVTKTASRRRMGLVFAHSHPTGGPWFSQTDDEGEARLYPFLRQRVPDHEHFALLVTPEGQRARVIGQQGGGVRLLEVGPTLSELSATYSPLDLDDRFDRQVRAFGPETQDRLSRLSIGIVGLGATGSAVAQQLAHLGVRQFLLIDPDRVDVTNLNRVIGSRPSDVGTPKVDVGRRLIIEINPVAKIVSFVESIDLTSTARRLLECDLVFCGTDSHGSRAILNQLAYQYLIPCIDLGVSIATREGLVTHAGARVQMLTPGLGCLVCGDFLDPDAVRHDLMTDRERSQDPYFVGGGAPQPAVVSLTSTAASLAVTMFLAAVAGIPSTARFQLYNAIAGTVRVVHHSPAAGCIVCSSRGALARGDEWPLPSRPA